MEYFTILDISRLQKSGLGLMPAEKDLTGRHFPVPVAGWQPFPGAVIQERLLDRFLQWCYLIDRLISKAPVFWYYLPFTPEPADQDTTTAMLNKNLRQSRQLF